MEVQLYGPDMYRETETETVTKTDHGDDKTETNNIGDNSINKTTHNC